MPPGDGGTGFGDDGSRDYRRALLVGCCLIAVVLAGTAVPALSAGEGVTGPEPAPVGVDPPDASIGVPGDGGERVTSAGGGRLGALTPGNRTSVGGPVNSNAFRSQDAAVHFTVRSPLGTYWRTGAYDVYTGDGWAQRGSSRAYDGPISSGSDRNGQQVRYDVVLNRSATALPTVWQPRTVNTSADLRVTPRRALRTANRLSAGTRFAGVSIRPVRDPAKLRTAGTDYPAAIERRYATLPEDVPNRIGRLTNRLTADAEGPYATARAIEQWLETNKSYSLNVSQTGTDVADTFIFEMEQGYCEYFATAMVVMLRSQGIPARYVVGYSTGQEIAPDTYRVRSLNAHAWVEMYVEGVGWVKFDPTPGGPRLQQERRSVRRQTPGQEYNPREEGSPGEMLTAPQASEGETDGPVRMTETGLRIGLNRTPVPGRTVSVTVTDGGDPVADAVVSFNGDPVGTTDNDGTVVGRVPYASQLRIGVGRTGTATFAATDERLYDSAAATGGNVTYPVETDANITVAGERRPGGAVTVSAAIRGTPVANATVLVDGDPTGRTGASGRATVNLPARSGRIAVAVVRGAVRGETTVALPAPSVSVEPSAPLALPLTRAEVRVTLGDRPVADAPVVHDGRSVGTTDAAGRAQITFPLAGRTTVSTEVTSLTARATVSGLLWNLAATVGLVTAPIVGLAALARRRGYALRQVPAEAVQMAGIGAGHGRRGITRLAAYSGRIASTLGDRFRARAQHLRATVPVWSVSQEGTSASRDGSPDPKAPSARGAWQRLLERTSVERPETKTPAEVARHAVREDRLPADAVRRLRDAFRAAEYGNQAPDADRVREALAAVEAARDGPDEDREEA